MYRMVEKIKVVPETIRMFIAGAVPDL